MSKYYGVVKDDARVVWETTQDVQEVRRFLLCRAFDGDIGGIELIDILYDVTHGRCEYDNRGI